MKDKKEIKISNLCIKYSFSCKRCPRYARCDKEIKEEEKKKNAKNLQ
jgi:hypothetical protein